MTKNLELYVLNIFLTPELLEIFPCMSYPLKSFINDEKLMINSVLFCFNLETWVKVLWSDI